MSKTNSRTLQQYAYNYLKNRILTDDISEHEIYSETKLAQDIGISRTPMRDAIQRLSQEGLIDILPSKGFSLHKLTPSDIIEIFQIRSAVEGFCTFLLAKEYKSEEGIETIEKLKLILKKQEEMALNGCSLSDFADYDSLFHTTIVSFAKNHAFDEIFNNYMYKIKKIAMEALSHEGCIETTLKEHSDILSCICNGDLENIYKVTLTHLESPKNINLNNLSY